MAYKYVLVKVHAVIFIWRWFLIHFTLTVVSCNLFPPPTAVSTPSKWANWCNSHFILCTKIEVGDGVWGCTRARHWTIGIRGGSPSPVLHRVTSDHLTRPQCWSAPSDSDLACFIQCHHWHTAISGWRCICYETNSNALKQLSTMTWTVLLHIKCKNNLRLYNYDTIRIREMLSICRWLMPVMNMRFSLHE